MRDDDQRPARARATIEYLAVRSPGGEYVPIGEIWSEVLRRFPLTEHERALTSKGAVRGEVAWRFASSDFVHAGWLRKRPDGSGFWAVTTDGIAALETFAGDAFLLEAQRRYRASRSKEREQIAEQLATRWLPLSANERRVLNAADQLVQQGLRDGQSAFSPNRTVWSEEVVGRLLERWLHAPDYPGLDFLQKLERQLEHASDDEKLLMAEIVTLQMLPIGGMGHAKKQARVSRVLGFMQHPVELPRVFDEAFGGGAFHPGPAMSTNINRAITVILEVLRAWHALEASAQEEALASPLAWRDVVQHAGGDAFPTQRNALLYLVHPEFFGPIVAADHREAIRNAFIGELEGEGSGDLDRDLFDIAIALQLKAQGAVDFYQAALADRWNRAVFSTAAQYRASNHAELELDGSHEDPDARGFGRDAVDVDQLESELRLSGDWLRRVVSALHRRGQVILYGPPGTGKTFVARALAEAITGDGSTVRRIQFHPSYTYEDFFAGYRPTADDAGQLRFELKRGPLREIADEARRNPEAAHVLLIDEINRANLSKVFGELYYLLEYRDDPIDVLYDGSGDDGGRSFTLPANVLIIGTMNTSDRSIALLDSAMRRRFSFFELHPDAEPLRGVLHRWARDHPQPIAVAALFDALNERIRDREDRIGPSHLLVPRQLELRDLEAIWEESILPLLEERHLGTDIDVRATYGLAALMSDVQAGERVAAPEVDGS